MFAIYRNGAASSRHVLYCVFHHYCHLNYNDMLFHHYPETVISILQHLYGFVPKHHVHTQTYAGSVYWETTTTSSSGEAQSSTGQYHITEWWTITRDAVYNTHLGCGRYPKNVGLWTLERYIAAHLLYSSAFITYSDFYLIIENPTETTPQCCLSINVNWTMND